MGTDRMLGGRYELWDVLGEGGMGTVHLGRDRHLERWVAVKVLHTDLVGDPVSRSRFRREAQTIARLDHPGIVTVHDVGWHHVEGTPDAPGSPFIVMEYVTGQTLHARLREGAIAVEEAIRHQLGLLHALEFSHHAGVVHRDIKPANVLVTRGGGIKVVDFGIACVRGDNGATAPRTRALVGTAHYLSPEQVCAEITDARSDLYSAGCLLYELLTGRPPFPGDDPIAIAYQHLHQAPPTSRHLLRRDHPRARRRAPHRSGQGPGRPVPERPIVHRGPPVRGEGPRPRGRPGRAGSASRGLPVTGHTSPAAPDSTAVPTGFGTSMRWRPPRGAPDHADEVVDVALRTVIGSLHGGSGRATTAPRTDNRKVRHELRRAAHQEFPGARRAGARDRPAVHRDARRRHPVHRG
ncbi:protein kinase domain-containing protein [Pseudonocardia sp.]|uniref:protein kinase domain-containing protein n=1 Tax=Pseudonocardia sp. TaxID=60912 RepID=UPI003D113C1B